MGRPQNDVDRVGVAIDDGRQGFDDVLDALARPEQPEREQNLLAFDTELVLVKTRVHERHVVDAVGDQLDLLIRNVVHVAQQFNAPMGHHNQAVAKIRQLVHHRPLARIGFAEDRVKGGDDRHAQLAEQGEDVTARRAAEDSELVLEIDNVHIVDVQEFRRPPIRRNLFLSDLEPYSVGVVVSVVHVVDGDDEDLGVAKRAGQSIGQVAGESGDPTLTRQGGADERDALQRWSSLAGHNAPGSASEATAGRGLAAAWHPRP